MRSGERVVIEDVTTSPVFAGTPALDVLLAAGVRAVQSTPLADRSGRLAGMLSTHYRAPRRPADRDLHVLDLLARQAADWIERTQAEEALRRAHDEMETRVRERTAELARANGALRAEVHERRRVGEARAELRRRLATAQEDECRRLSRELHGGAGQQLTFLILGLKALRDGGREPAAGQGLLERLQRTAEEVGRELHDLALRLRPTALDDLGLLVALQSAVEKWSRRAGMEVDFHSFGLQGQRLPGEVETALYRVVLEALMNALKHARARHTSIILERRDNHAVAIVEDDGVGFDAEAALTSPSSGRLGLLGMRERVALVGGALEVESTPGAGTTVFARIPLPLTPFQG
jgi:signal transduction histidine kinase